MESQIRGLDSFVRTELVRTCREMITKFQPEHDAYLTQRPDAPKTVTHKQARY